MLRSIRAEWYKAVRRPYFPILFLTCTLLTVGAVYCLYLIKTQSPGITPIGLPFALSLSPLGMVMGLWLVAIGGDLVFSEQYKHHTLKNEVSFGIPRARIYLSRWAAVFLVMLLLYAVLVAVYTLSALLLLGLDRDPSGLTSGGGFLLSVYTLTAHLILFLISLPLYLFHGQLIQLMGRRLCIRHSKGKDGFQLIIFRKAQAFPYIFLRGYLIRVPEPALDPAAADPQAGCHQMHVCHGNGTVLNPHVLLLFVANDNDSALCFLQHFHASRPASGEIIQGLSLAHHDKLPRAFCLSRRRQKACLKHFRKTFLRNLLTAVVPDAAPSSHNL